MKDKLRILLVSNGFYPEISARSFRATELALEFQRQGHEVRVITKFRDYNYAGYLADNPFDLLMWGKSKLPPVRQCKGKLSGFFTRVLSRFLNLVFEYPTIEDMFRVKAMLKNKKNYDLMISFAVPHPVHWGVAWAKSVSHPIAKTWIADCGDPYMGDILDTFRHPFYFKYLEKWFCRKADYISIPFEGARKGYYKEFQSKIKIIPQGFNFQLGNLAYVEPENDQPSFAYAGELISGVRDPEPLLKYLSEINESFRFYIFTNKPEVVRSYSVKLGDKLVISDYIPRKELLDFFAKMNFLINFDNNSDRNLPSKLIDYAISGRPVLNIKKDFDRDLVMDFIKGNYSKKMVLPEPHQYHITNISQMFLSLV